MTVLKVKRSESKVLLIEGGCSRLNLPRVPGRAACSGPSANHSWQSPLFRCYTGVAFKASLAAGKGVIGGLLDPDPMLDVSAMRDCLCSALARGHCKVTGMGLGMGDKSLTIAVIRLLLFS